MGLHTEIAFAEEEVDKWRQQEGGAWQQKHWRWPHPYAAKGALKWHASMAHCYCAWGARVGGGY